MVFEHYNELSMNKLTQPNPTQRYSLCMSEECVRINRNGVEISVTDDNPIILAKLRMQKVTRLIRLRIMLKVFV